MRAIWPGAIGFGFVNILVKLFNVVHSKSRDLMAQLKESLSAPKRKAS